MLLAGCDALIRYPSGSFVSLYSAVIKPSRLPLPATVEDLLAPWDPADSGTPAVLF